MRLIAPFPPTDETLAQWICVFNNAATYGNYVSYLQKCCFLLKFTTSWFTPCVRHVAKGLKKRQNRSFRSHNFIRSSLLAKIVERKSTKSEFAQSASLSFLFAIRVPSDTLQLRRAYRGDKLLDPPPNQTKR